MSYTLTIGKAQQVDDSENYGERCWIAAECEGPAPHADEYEAVPFAGEPVRLPAYSAWWNVLQALPHFKSVWERLEAVAVEREWDVIPITEYARDIDAIEAEAAQAEPGCAARAYWFTRWSRHALKLYGEAAVFETPGEWR